MATGWLCEERYFWHDTGNWAGLFPSAPHIEAGTHFESPETKRRLRNLVEVSGLLDQLVQLRARPAGDDELLRCHTERHLEHIRAVSAAGGGDAGDLTPMGAGGYEIAALAAGGVISAVDAVLDGTVDNVYALTRPPGHHARPERAMGFCIFANAAIAARHARVARGLARVAILDWDVHHGNGTQEIFWEDPSVLTVSIHEDGSYPPGSGTVEEVGAGDGEGSNLNIPLPPGSGPGAYEAALERVVAPAMRAFRPELVIVASGLDANMHDPLARMLMHSDGYRRLTRIMLDLAGELCEGRLVVEHEGGYSPVYVPYCGLAIVEELAGVRTGVEDPFLPLQLERPWMRLQPQQDEAIRAAEANLSRLVAA